MVNASLNWASIVGLLLLAWWIPAGFMGFVQLLFVLQRRADFSWPVFFGVIRVLLISFGRIVLLPLTAGILFFQGWRLDPILQFGQFCLALGLVVESASGVVADYRNWRARPGDIDLKSGCFATLKILAVVISALIAIGLLLTFTVNPEYVKYQECQRSIDAQFFNSDSFNDYSEALKVCGERQRPWVWLPFF